MRGWVAAAAIAALASTGQAQSINPMATEIMEQSPCTVALSFIDRPPESLPQSERDRLIGLGRKALLFGYLTGFQAAHPELQEGQVLTVDRLRSACADSPQASTKALLEALAQEASSD